MKNIRRMMLFLFLIYTGNNILAQSGLTSANEVTHKYQYLYSFENGSSAEVVKQTEESISGLLHVTEVKSVFKAESGRGQFIITVIEKDRTTESEELFSPKLVKEVILQNGIQPLDFTVTEEIIK